MQRSRRLKQIVWMCGQRKALERADCFHATAKSEVEDIRRMGFRTPVAIVPNGIDIPARLFDEKSRGSGPKRLLYLGRIHPKKGLDNLLRAWKTLQKKFPSWELHVAGPDQEGYLPMYQQLAASLELKRVEFLGPVYGERKSQVYSSADLFVLPTHSENFGMTVAEALAHSVPAVVTRGAPWRGLEEQHCGWWIEIGHEPLVHCLNEVMTLTSQELAAWGARGREWMQREYSWNAVGRMMHETYRWLLGGGDSPGWVERN
jgi:glycosyltransferase involved in cell wall biosynthesis